MEFDAVNPTVRSAATSLSVRSAAILVASLIIGFLIFEIRHTLSCFLLSFILAYLFDPLVVLLERKASRITGIIILYGGLAVFSLFCLIYLIPFLTLRWEALSHNFPYYMQKIKALIENLRDSNQPMYGADEWRWLLDQVADNLDAVYTKLGGWGYATAATMAFNIFNLLLAPILVFFMLLYKEIIKETITGFLPARYREALLDVGRDINRSMTGFIRGQLIVSVIVAVLVTAALFLLDVDYPLFSGIFAGITSVIPFVGVILAAVPALFFAFVKFQSVLVLMKVIAAFSFIYFVEGYVIKPLVFRESMDLNPLLTILMVMALGELLGFWGILLAIPIAASLRIFSAHVKRGVFAQPPPIFDP